MRRYVTKRIIFPRRYVINRAQAGIDTDFVAWTICWLSVWWIVEKRLILSGCRLG